MYAKMLTDFFLSPFYYGYFVSGSESLAARTTKNNLHEKPNKQTKIEKNIGDTLQFKQCANILAVVFEHKAFKMKFGIRKSVGKK